MITDDVSEVPAVSIIRAIISLMEAASAYETSMNFYQTIRRNNPEDSHLQHYKPSKSALN
jgi:hypothetical protein